VDHVTDAVMVVIGAHHLVGVVVVVRLGAGRPSGEQGRGGDGNCENGLHGKLLFRYS
jgi:hypothetical protein